MGDRALVVFTDGQDFSPAIYIHWGGAEVRSYIEAALPRMRSGDISYSAARFIGTCHEQMDGNTGLGVLAPPDDLNEASSEKFSHGDAGVFVVDVNTWKAQAFNGYGFDYDKYGKVMAHQFDASAVPQ